MTDAAAFLLSLAKAVTGLGLYPPQHPARERALDVSYERLSRLQETQPTARFTFLEEMAVLGRRPVPSLSDWEYGKRLWDAGIQRLELTGPVEREELEAFIEDVHGRLGATGTRDAKPAVQTAHLRYGTLGLRSGAWLTTRSGSRQILTFSLGEEVEAVDWIYGELRRTKALHLAEAEMVVHSLSLIMRNDEEPLIPMLRFEGLDRYATTHAMNVSALAMALSEFLGLGEKQIRAFGLAGLLHDIGNTTVPPEILDTPGPLSDEDREIVQRHPAEGARIILETERDLDLAATVAYEHHARPDGEGYPRLPVPGRCHQASDLVHVCDVFDALHSERPFRAQWERGEALKYIEDGAGQEFDPDLALSFVRMMRKWDARLTEVENPDEPLLVAAHRPGVDAELELMDGETGGGWGHHEEGDAGESPGPAGSP